jgi:hypothetical protein
VIDLQIKHSVKELTAHFRVLRNQLKLCIRVTLLIAVHKILLPHALVLSRQSNPASASNPDDGRIKTYEDGYKTEWCHIPEYINIPSHLHKSVAFKVS